MTRPGTTGPDVRGLAGVDGLDVETGPPRPGSSGRPPLRLDAEAAAIVRGEIERARGREVCFLCEVTPQGGVVRPRAVARGNREAVLAVARDAPEGSLLLHNHPSGVLEPSAADLAVAARVWEEGLGSAITDNAASDLYVIVEPPAPREIVPLDPVRLERIVGPNGALSRAHAGWEDREGQRRMIRLVAERYNEGGVLLVEAGTGTGKSLAYLLPAAQWALQNGERTVVSTNTINLQAQLVRNDLPLVQRLSAELAASEAGDATEADRADASATGGAAQPPRELTWALVKGRGNYLSIRRARLAAQSAPSLFEDDRSDELGAILAWAGRTEEGSLQDLPFAPTGEVWEEVRSDPDICMRGKCPHFQQCFYQRSRRRAASADVVVVNHHLLFTDLAVRRATRNWSQSAVLPSYDRLVLDEAHNLEDAATSHLGVELTRSGMMRLLSRLDRQGKGVLTAVHEGLAGGGDRATELRRDVETRVRPLLEETRSETLNLVDALEGLLTGGGEAVRIGPGEDSLPEPAADPAVGERLERLLARLGRLERELSTLRRRIDAEEELAERLEARLLDLSSVERRLAALQHGLRLVLAPGEDEAAAHVRWLERRGSGRRENLVLAAAPIELGPLLRETLFAHTDTVVLSSATLSTRRRFDFLRGRLGLSPSGVTGGTDTAPGFGDAEPVELPEVVEALVPSPFDFQRQVLLAVPTDLPDARSGNRRLQEATARVLEETAGVTDGGLFGLFTSHRALRQVAALLRERGVDGRWPLFVHGEADRARLLEDFVRAGSGILLGTASFWEGVDVPGDPLRGLVIQKLPFRVPTEPVTAARVEAIERAGGNAFYDFMLPLAALRLKQGFGRLVRSREDRGVVLLLDDRVLRQRYGRYLLDSLPDAPLARGPWADLRRRLEAFYATDASVLAGGTGSRGLPPFSGDLID